MGIVLLFSIILNLILIPQYQAVGASITVLAANALMTILGMYWAGRTIRFNFWGISYTAFKAIVAAALMAALVFYLKSMINVFLVILLGGGIYFTMLFLLRAFTWKDAVSMYNLFFHKQKS